MAGTNTTAEFDFVVAGGGTAGNAVAGRLAEDPKVSVAVIEAGPSNTREIDIITTPAKAFETRNSKWDWKFKATFVDRDDYTRVEKPDTRGKVLGGSSCLNYYTWVRGSKGTFDDWKAYGGDLWGWNQCEEYFDKPATYHDKRHEISASLQRINRNGPLPVSVSNMLPEAEEFRNALEKAWTSKGHPLEDNVYEGVQRGLVKNLNSIYKGVRSTSVCFLDGKPNITIISETNVDRLIIDNGVATGVEVTVLKGNKGTIKAKKEVILSAGVFKTPQILIRSGARAAVPARRNSRALLGYTSGSSAWSHIQWSLCYFSIVQSCRHLQPSGSVHYLYPVLVAPGHSPVFRSPTIKSRS